MSTPYRLREEPADEIVVANEPAKTLGRLRSTHPTGKSVRRVGIAAGAIALALGVMTLAWPGALAVVALVLIGAAVVAAWVGFTVVLGLDVTVDVHEHGLRIHRSARRSLDLRYEDIRALYQHGGTEWQLELADGRSVFVPMKVEEANLLAVAIERDVERPVLEDAVRSLASAEVLTFGTLALELDGIRHEGDFLPWSELGFVRVDEHAFVFIEKATQLSFVVLPTETVPFPRVLVALLARRTALQTAGPFWTRFV